MPSKKEWGEAMWFYLHTFAGAYPDQPTEEERKDALDFISICFKTLVCNVCSNHAQAYLIYNPLDKHLDNSDSFQKYLYDMHNSVNERLKDSEPKPFRHTFEEVRDAFKSGAWKAFGGYPFPDSINPMTVAEMQKLIEKQEEEKQGIKNAELEAEEELNIVFYVLVAIMLIAFLLIIILVIALISTRRNLNRARAFIATIR